MITYLLKSGLLLLIFYAVYKLWLENEKMFRFNRAYLLGSLVLSFVIPLQLISLDPWFENAVGYIQLEEIIIQTNGNQQLETISGSQYAMLFAGIFYALVALLLTVRFIRNLYSFYAKQTKNEVQVVEDVKVVLIEKPVLPHSFWKTIFINKKEFEEGKIPSELIAHEKAHLTQKHTLDILLIEVLQILFWFNPMIIFYKKAIKLNHEFLADEAVNKQFESVREYQNLLLNIASNKNTIALASNINYVITKKRLLMMTKKESPFKIAIKIGGTAIVCVLMLVVFSTKTMAQKGLEKNTTSQEYKKLTEVEVQPEFPGGMMGFYKFVGQQYKIPAELSKTKAMGKIFLSFMIEKDGSLTDITIVDDKLGYGAGEEAARVLKLSPKWKPAYDGGEPVRVMYSLPITIQADK
ncbi:M56 family metallopeptidase [Flavobacterium hercynium]|uniref:Peptidase M56, BlaR1 n=1 Tax=Flavobacterium hercynium TaxID=387094 RepID=A0A226HEV9_9FLAO|nr:M56 family metallopeptidase [Flavobacterium hercynium]OXA92813.1 peptidase M56, BlaR1 [Flavobacterium hercynium]SMP02339.1 Signal transducer regulating beta-lactamase production, contains metallopeptidase domain [Flavobacterium hercynium]